jgi:hypothetical protein
LPNGLDALIPIQYQALPPRRDLTYVLDRVLARDSLKYTDPQLIALLHTPDSKMINGGMTPVDLEQADVEALAAYLLQLH